MMAIQTFVLYIVLISTIWTTVVQSQSENALETLRAEWQQLSGQVQDELVLATVDNLNSFIESYKLIKDFKSKIKELTKLIDQKKEFVKKDGEVCKKFELLMPILEEIDFNTVSNLDEFDTLYRKHSNLKEEAHVIEEFHEYLEREVDQLNEKIQILVSELSQAANRSTDHFEIALNNLDKLGPMLTLLEKVDPDKSEIDTKNLKPKEMVKAAKEVLKNLKQYQQTDTQSDNQKNRLELLLDSWKLNTEVGNAFHPVNLAKYLHTRYKLVIDECVKLKDDVANLSMQAIEACKNAEKLIEVFNVKRKYQGKELDRVYKSLKNRDEL